MGKFGSGGAEIGRQVASRKTWVQTERAAHEAWAGLIARKPRAAMLLHHFVALMGEKNAVVVSQKTLGKMLGVTDRTVRSAVADLVAERWISVVKLNGPGTVSAYVVNDRVAWGERRDKLPLSLFSAVVVADQGDQDEALLGHGELRRIPSLYPGELQLPSGPGEKPPSQPHLEGLEPDLPHIDQETGEILSPYEAERRRLGLPEGADIPNPFGRMTPEQIEQERGRVFQAGLEARGQGRLEV